MWRAADLVALAELEAPERELPPHLADVPHCLHKYEPLLRETWLRRERPQSSDAESAAA